MNTRALPVVRAKTPVPMSLEEFGTFADAYTKRFEALEARMRGVESLEARMRGIERSLTKSTRCCHCGR